MVLVHFSCCAYPITSKRSQSKNGFKPHLQRGSGTNFRLNPIQAQVSAFLNKPYVTIKPTPTHNLGKREKRAKPAKRTQQHRSTEPKKTPVTKNSQQFHKPNPIRIDLKQAQSQQPHDGTTSTATQSITPSRCHRRRPQAQLSPSICIGAVTGPSKGSFCFNSYFKDLGL